MITGMVLSYYECKATKEKQGTDTHIPSWTTRNSATG